MSVKAVLVWLLLIIVALFMMWYLTEGYYKKNTRGPEETFYQEENIEVLPLEQVPLTQEKKDAAPVIIEEDAIIIETPLGKEIEKGESSNNPADKLQNKFDKTEEPINLSLTRYRYENVQKIIRENKKSLLNFAYPHVRSHNPDAITIVGFFDFANQECRKMYPIIDKIARSGRVNYIFRDHLVNKPDSNTKNRETLTSPAALAAFKAYIIDYKNHLDFRAKLANLDVNYSDEEIKQLASKFNLNPDFSELNLKQIELTKIFPFEKYQSDTQDLAGKLNILEVKQGFAGDFFHPPVFIIGERVLSGPCTEDAIWKAVNEEEKTFLNQSPAAISPSLQLTENYIVDPNSEELLDQYKYEIVQGEDCKDAYIVSSATHPTYCTIIGLCDFLTHSCQTILPEIKKLIEADKVNYVFRDLPFTKDNDPSYEESIKLASTMLNVPYKVKNLSYLNFLEESIQILKRNPQADLSFLFTEFGFTSKFYSPKFSPLSTQELISDNISLGQKLNYNSQPTFIIGNKLIVRGTISAEHLLDLVTKVGCEHNYSY